MGQLPARIRGSPPQQLPLRPPRLLPTLRRLCPPPAHKPPWSLLRLQEAATFSGSQPSMVCAAATESIFVQKQDGCEKNNNTPNHTQGVDQAGSLALNNGATTSLMGNKNKQPTQGAGLGASTAATQLVPGSQTQATGVPASWRDCLPPLPLLGTRPGKVTWRWCPHEGMEGGQASQPLPGARPFVVPRNPTR